MEVTVEAQVREVREPQFRESRDGRQFKKQKLVLTLYDAMTGKTSLLGCDAIGKKCDLLQNLQPYQWVRVIVSIESKIFPSKYGGGSVCFTDVTLKNLFPAQQQGAYPPPQGQYMQQPGNAQMDGVFNFNPADYPPQPQPQGRPWYAQQQSPTPPSIREMAGAVYYQNNSQALPPQQQPGQGYAQHSAARYNPVPPAPEYNNPPYPPRPLMPIQGVQPPVNAEPGQVGKEILENMDKIMGWHTADALNNAGRQVQAQTQAQQNQTPAQPKAKEGSENTPSNNRG